MQMSFYIIYLSISSCIVLHVGHQCFKHGSVYISYVFPKQIEFANRINKLLLLAYYLLNIGLSVYNLNQLKKIHNISDGIVELCLKLSTILLILAVLHCINISSIYLYYLLTKIK